MNPDKSIEACRLRSLNRLEGFTGRFLLHTWAMRPHQRVIWSVAGVRPESCGMSALVKGQRANPKGADFAIAACLSAIVQAKGEATSAEFEFLGFTHIAGKSRMRESPPPPRQWRASRTSGSVRMKVSND